MKNKASILDEVIKRRMPQFVGVYIAIGWTIIQFTDWLTQRYQYSPHLVDLALAIIISMIPSILVLSYFHGAPGKDKWTKVEKITLPLNAIISIATIFIIFYPKDLGATTKSVTYEEEDGTFIDRVIPKSEFRKNIILFNYDVDDTIVDEWLSVGITSMIEWDLIQDIYINSSVQNQVNHFLKDYNKNATDLLSLSLQREIAKKKYCQYFVNGNISMDDGVYSITTKIYKTKNGKVVNKITTIPHSDTIKEAWLKTEVAIRSYHVVNRNNNKFSDDKVMKKMAKDFE